MNVNRVPQVASRVAYELFVGPIASELYVCHTCDNPACVNPEHLFLGAPLDNTNDMISKERNVRGEQSPNAKLTDKLVRRGRLLRAQGMSYVAIGERLGVSESVARRAVKGQTWAHVD